MANFTGTTGNDTYFGTGGADTISDGGGGGDTLNGNGGNDTITVSGPGNDMVDGGSGFDTLIVDFSAALKNISTTSSGASRIFTDYSGQQVAFVGIESLNIRTGSGADTIVTGNGGFDSVTSGEGDDAIDTGRGMGFVNGGLGSDRWTVDFSDNATAISLNLNAVGTTILANGSRYTSIERLTLLAGDGNDAIITRTGSPDVRDDDSVNGGGGDDRITVGGGFDTVDGGDGIDTLVVSYGLDTNNFSMTSSGAQTIITDFANTQVAYSSIERFDLTLGSGADTVVLGDDADTVRGGLGDDDLDTRKGSAIVNGGPGVDRWRADFSDSLMRIQLDINAVSSVPATRSFVTQIEMVSLTGTVFDDVVITGRGSPDLRRDDWVDGGDGDDTITVGGGFDTVEGGEGLDTLMIDWAADTNNFSMTASGAQTIISDFANTQVAYMGVERFDITLGSGNDTVVLGDGADVARGGAGNDDLDTRRGGAVVDGGAGVDRWRADFSDTATALNLNINDPTSAAAAGVSVAGIEMVTLVGGSGADVIITTVGSPDLRYDDSINGGGGDDRITVGGGFDTVDGGTGLDTLVVDWSADSNAVRMTTSGALTVISDFANTQVAYQNVEQFDVSLGSGNDTVVLGNGADVVRGGDGADDLDTRRGAAVVDGGSGDDRWRADFTGLLTPISLNINLAVSTPTAGSSIANIEMVSVVGTIGADTIVTGVGSPDLRYDDSVNGGGGDDVITVGGGFDTVDGGAGADTLVINYLADASSFRMTASGAHVIISDFVNTQVAYQNIERFDVTLGSGNDTVVLGDGADTVRGGLGADDLDTRKGAAVVDGGGGVDRWRADFSTSTVGLTLNLNDASTAPAPGSSVTGVEMVTLVGSALADVIVTTVGSPNERYDDSVVGGAGDDVVTVGGGFDVVDGDAGVDTLVVDWTNDTSNFSMTSSGVHTIISDFANTQVAHVNVERFDVTLGSGNDVVTLGDDDDTVRGGAGNDDLDTRKGDAVVDGGAGVDRWRADFSESTTGISLNINLAVTSPTAGSSVQGVEQVTLIGSGLADVIVTHVGSPDARYDDNVIGGNGNDVITVGGGFDTVDGGDGFDTLVINYAGDDDRFSVTTSGDYVVITDFRQHPSRLPQHRADRPDLRRAERHHQHRRRLRYRARRRRRRRHLHQRWRRPPGRRRGL
jgi:Ca2+-binding RTX toxin-like protein